MALTWSGRDIDKTLPGSVLVERTQKCDKAGQTCSLCWDFLEFFSLGKEGAIVVFGWSSMVVLSIFCVLLCGHLGPGSAGFFLVPNERQHCSSQALSFHPPHMQSCELTQGTAGTQILGCCMGTSQWAEASVGNRLYPFHGSRHL